MKKPSIAFVGGGKTCKVLGKLLAQAEYNIVGVHSRTPDSARRAVQFIGAGQAYMDAHTLVSHARLTFITTPDAAIQEVCHILCQKRSFQKASIVVHCAGSYSSEILAEAHSLGASVSSFHPLRSLENMDYVVRHFRETYCGYEGDTEALPALEAILNAIGGIGLKIAPEAKQLYHSASVFASNYSMVLFDIALRLFAQAGIAPKQATPALLQLMCGTLHNVEQVGLPQALTGPIERGDVETIQRHLKKLRPANPQWSMVYCALGQYTVQLALQKRSISKEQAERLQETLR